MPNNNSVLNIDNVVDVDQIAGEITDKWVDWNGRRRVFLDELTEIRQHVFATDTSAISNMQSPWKNKTVMPKLCQIRDNLHSNYMHTLFPKRRWLTWEGESEDDENSRSAIENYMVQVIERSRYEEEIEKCVLDYIDSGNAFTMPGWIDTRVNSFDTERGSYVGPKTVRIDPLDIVFDPTVGNFIDTPKIIREFTTLGDLKKRVESMSTGPDKEIAENAFNRMVTLRKTLSDGANINLEYQDKEYTVDGFSDYRHYLMSDTVEMLHFYGTLYDIYNDKLYNNHHFVVVDKHFLIFNKPLPTYLPHVPIYQAVWRKRQNNLWGMSPLANLLGLQYRLNHVENQKADLLELILAPPIKVKGYVQDFDWQPYEKVFIQDIDSDVELMSPDVNALQANFELDHIMKVMEEMAGAPGEAMGIRSPGEKTKFEVQSINNASSRIFQRKTINLERNIIEPTINTMLLEAQNNFEGGQLRVVDEDLQIANFQELTREDITAKGTLKPRAASHFAEQAQIVQNLNSFFSTSLGQDPQVLAHWSSFRTAKAVEELLNLEKFNLVERNVRLAESVEQQSEAAIMQEQTETAFATGGGPITEDEV